MSFSRKEERAPGSAVHVEDDGWSGYAYILGPSGVEGFVWLYNRLPHPTSLEEERGRNAPMNAKEFITPAPFSLPEDEGEFAFN